MDNPEFPNHIPFVEGSTRNNKCTNKDCANCIYSCVDCDKENGVFTLWEKQKNIANIQTDSIKPYYDIGIGREITSKTEIKQICKENGYVYGSDSDFANEAKRNKEYLQNSFTEGLHQEIMRNI